MIELFNRMLDIAFSSFWGFAGVFVILCLLVKVVEYFFMTVSVLITSGDYIHLYTTNAIKYIIYK